MSEWYEQLELGSDLVRISEPRVGPLLSAKLWWLRGTDRDIVVDAGLGVVALRGEILRMFERDPLVVLTHAHLDHVGGAHEFRERAGHPAEAATLAEGVPASLYGAELYAKLGIDAGDEPVPDLLIKSLPYPEYDPRTYRVQAVTLSRQLDDGDRIDLGSGAKSPGITSSSLSTRSPVHRVISSSHRT